MCWRQSLKTRTRCSRARLAFLLDLRDARACAQALLQRERERAGARRLLARIAASVEIRAVAPQQHAAEEPPAMFGDVAGLDALKKSLRLEIIEPFRNPGLFARFRKSAGGGVMLYGPPGCGKTLIARALAGEAGGRFINVGVAEIVSVWFGQS
jgi:ATP-dependent 26S proteasome regulatory subunit